MSSARISFTKVELIRLRSLQELAWGRTDKAWTKLNKAIEQIESKEQES